MSHDVGIIRPEMRAESVRARGEALDRRRKAALRGALRTLHTLEIMATKIYACQITARPCALNTSLTAAMCNEMTHAQDFQTKLYEHGFTPSKLRWAYWLVGYVFGLGSRVLGPKRILKTGVWVEKKAVRHYEELIKTVDWDEETLAILRKDQADESGHIRKWGELLKQPDPVC